jgi:hypothetical protein
VEVNAVKAEIDSLTEALEVKRAAAGSSGSTGGEPGVLDDETYQLLGQLKAAKARWVGAPVSCRAVVQSDNCMARAVDVSLGSRQVSSNVRACKCRQPHI